MDGTQASEPIPPMAIDPRDVVDAPSWVGVSHYRDELPARAVDGVASQAYRYSIGDDPPRRIRYEPASRRLLPRLHEAAERGEPVAFYGLSRTLNVMTVPPCTHSWAVARSFVAGVAAAGLPIWIDIARNQGAAQFAQLLPAIAHTPRAMRRAQRAKFEAGLVGIRDDLAALLAAASGVIAATEPLGDFARQFNARVRVIPDCVDPAAVRRELRPADPRPLRLGVALNQEQFAYDVREALPGLLDAADSPDVALCFYGGYPVTLPYAIEAESASIAEAGRITVAGVPCRYRAWEPSLHRYRRELWRLDMAALPLNPELPFNRFKSGKSWMEHALHGTAAVCQRLDPFDLAEDEKTCLKAGSTEEWREQLARLVSNARLRRRIGEAARTAVIERHSLGARRPLWEALLAEASGAGTHPSRLEGAADVAVGAVA